MCSWNKTERQGRPGDYWPEFVTVRTKRREAGTKTTDGQYYPVSIDTLLGPCLFWIYRFSKTEIHRLWLFPSIRSVWRNLEQEKTIRTLGFPSRLPCHIIIGTFRFEYECEIEYENDFSILGCRLHIITTQAHLIPWASFSTKTLTS